MKNECSIVRDILPLYAEKMVSKDTAEFVKGHLENCPVCRAELEKLREPVEVQTEPQTDIDAAPLKRLKKALLMKKVQTILCTAAVLLALVLSVISFLTAPKYFAYSPELVTVTKTEGGYIVLSFDERITNYTLQRIITGKDIKEKVYYLEVWTTSWDRLTGRHGVQNALVRETAGLPVYIFFQQNYTLNDVDMDSVCIYGNLSRLNGSWVALPGLSLGYWLLFNIALFLILGCMWFILRRREHIRRCIERAIPIPVAYGLGHLCVLGFRTASYSQWRDFQLIFAIGVLFYCAMLLALSIFYKRKEIKDAKME